MEEARRPARVKGGCILRDPLQRWPKHRLCARAAGMALPELVVDGNSLCSLAGLATCANLRELSAADNRLRSLDGLSGLRALELLNVAGNELSTLHGTAPGGEHAPVCTVCYARIH